MDQQRYPACRASTEASPGGQSPDKGDTARSRSPLAYRSAKFVFGRALRLFYRVRVQGVDNLPDEGPVILAANHRSFMDSVFLALTTPRPVSFIAKAEYFDRPVSRWIFSRTGAIPLRRGPAGARQALAAASKGPGRRRHAGRLP